MAGLREKGRFEQTLGKSGICLWDEEVLGPEQVTYRHRASRSLSVVIKAASQDCGEFYRKWNSCKHKAWQVIGAQHNKCILQGSSGDFAFWFRVAH